MDNIDKLIKELQEAKQELAKGQNCDSGSAPNMSGAMKHDIGDGRTVKGPSPSPEAVDTQIHGVMAAKSDGVGPVEVRNSTIAGGEQNMASSGTAGAGATAKSDGLDDRWGKRKDMGDGRVVTGDEPSPKQVDKQMRSVAEKSDDVLKSGEYFTLFKNGQWNLDKAEQVPMTPALKESKKASPKGLPYAGEKK